MTLKLIDSPSDSADTRSQSKNSNTHTQYTEKMGSAAFIERLSNQLQTLILPFLQDSKDEVSAHIQRLIKTTLQDQGLVTREMFDVQQALLAKTRLKLEALKEQLENHLKTQG